MNRQKKKKPNRQDIGRAEGEFDVKNSSRFSIYGPGNMPKNENILYKKKDDDQEGDENG